MNKIEQGLEVKSEITQNEKPKKSVNDVYNDSLDDILDEYEQRRVPNDVESYSKEELKDLWENDSGYMNGEFLLTDKHYDETGIRKAAYSKDSTGEVEKAVLNIGDRIIQYAHPGESGRYFAQEGTKYEDLQLVDSRDKRILNVYEVQEQLTVEMSFVAEQDANKSKGLEFHEGVVQYKTQMLAETLEEQGILKRLNKLPGR